MSVAAPPEAGRVLVDFTKPHMFQTVAGIAMLVIVAGMPLFDRSLWRITAVILALAAIIAAVALTMRYFIRRLQALCENGLVVRKRGRTSVVPWTAIRTIKEHQTRKYNVRTLAMQTDAGWFAFDNSYGAKRFGEAVGVVKQNTRLADVRQ